MDNWPETSESLILRLNDQQDATAWNEFLAIWEMFHQTAIDGKPVTEVADGLGRSAGAVYIARCRVMQRLKEKVQELSHFWSDEL